MGGYSDTSKDETQRSTSVSTSQNTAAQQATSATTLLQQQLPYMEKLWGAGGQLIDQGGAGVTDQARGAWGDALSGQVNPGVADVIDNASREMGLNFQRDTLPGIRRNAIGSGALGGSRQGIAEGLAAGELARAQGTMSTELLTRALDDARLERSNALNLSGTMAQLPWVGLQSFAQTLGAPVMQSYGQSSAASSGSAGATVNSTGVSTGDGQSFSIAGKK